MNDPFDTAKGRSHSESFIYTKIKNCTFSFAGKLICAPMIDSLRLSKPGRAL